MKKITRLVCLALILVLTALLFINISAKTTGYNFTVGSSYGSRDEFSFEVTSTGNIKVTATWTGTATNLALILNGPGQTNYYQRMDGKSPLTVTQAVTSTILAKGTTWKASIVNFSGSGTAAGTFKIDYPYVAPTPVKQVQDNFSVGSTYGARDEYSFQVTEPGTIRIQASWTGSVANLALILNGPGQSGYYQRIDGPSPLTVTQLVTSQILAKGSTWTVSIVNFNGAGTGTGAFKIEYPYTEPPPTQQKQQNFNVGSAFGDRDVFNFEVTTIGTIRVQASWTGAANNLALVLNGPGQVGYYQRLDGPSPLVVTQKVDAAILAKGTTWQASIVNLSGAGTAAGTFLIDYPIVVIPTPLPSTSQKQVNFDLTSTFGDRDEISFEVTTAGTIKIEAAWTGNAENLALILNGPGQVGYYQRLDGPSPLTVTQQVTSAILAKGTTWKASIVNFSGGGAASGSLTMSYPGVEITPMPSQASQQKKQDFSVGATFGDRDILDFQVTTIGTIKVQASWTGGAKNLALVLNGPGQTGYYQRLDGPSPLTVTQVVTSAILAKGVAWQASIVNLSGTGTATGAFTVDYPVVVATPIPQVTAKEFDMRVNPVFGDRSEYSFEVTAPGTIKIQAEWTGSAKNLSLFLNGPGQTNAYQTKTGASPLVVTQQVTNEMVAKGTTWKVTLINMTFLGNAVGKVKVEYPTLKPAVIPPTQYEIFDRLQITNVEKTPTKAIITVAYALTTSHAVPVYLGAAMMNGANESTAFGYKPAPVFAGIGTATVEITTTGNQTMSTDRIAIFLYEGGMVPFARYIQDLALDWNK